MTFSFSFRTVGAALLALAMPAALAVLPTQSASAQSNDLASVARAIRAITTLKATFQQGNPNGQVQSGTLLLKQPGHIRFDYQGGDLLIVADGKSLNMIDYEVGQVQRWPIRNSPLGALLDPSRDLTRYGKLVPTGDPRIVSVEVRDAAHPEYGVLSLVFTRKDSAPGGLELTGWIAKDAQGNRTTIRLSNVSYGVGIPGSAFTWRDPRPNMKGPH
ncbi:MAG: outer membrane lipoprotein carrier protein LolA [Sphingobium sp.]|nr:outer membrane lipoprotein carrier protein LolA [Sphingobium sp.]